MRLSHLVWLIVAAAIGVSVLHTKYRVQVLEEELRQTDRAILADQEAIHVLEAEWAYLGHPDRLARLARRYLDLEHIAPERIGTLADLPKHLSHIYSKETAARAPLKPEREKAPGMRTGTGEGMVGG